MIEYKGELISNKVKNENCDQSLARKSRVHLRIYRALLRVYRSLLKVHRVSCGYPGLFGGRTWFSVDIIVLPKTTFTYQVGLKQTQKNIILKGGKQTHTKKLLYIIAE